MKTLSNLLMRIRMLGRFVGAVFLSFVPALALAQNSPFQTGADSMVTNFVAIATPFAILIVMALGVAAAMKLVSWAWPISFLGGIAALFGAPQIVTWVRGMFGV